MYGLDFLDSKGQIGMSGELWVSAESGGKENTLSYASIMGIQKNDIGLKSDNYQWLGSVFNFGNLFASFVLINQVFLFRL